MWVVGLDEMEIYIFRHHNTATQYIVNRPIMDLSLEEEGRPGLWVGNGGGRRRDYNLRSSRRPEKGGMVGIWRGELSRTMRQLLEVEGVILHN